MADRTAAPGEYRPERRSTSALDGSHGVRSAGCELFDRPRDRVRDSAEVSGLHDAGPAGFEDRSGLHQGGSTRHGGAARADRRTSDRERSASIRWRHGFNSVLTEFFTQRGLDFYLEGKRLG